MARKILLFYSASFWYLYRALHFHKMFTSVKYWRENGINVVLYLDDGFGMCLDKKQCIYESKFVKQSLIDAGFLINKEKSVFDPVQCLEWLGIIWNSTEF